MFKIGVFVGAIIGVSVGIGVTLWAKDLERRSKRYYLKKNIKVKNKLTLQEIQEHLQLIENFRRFKKRVDENIVYSAKIEFNESYRCFVYDLDNDTLNIVISALDGYYKEIEKSISRYIEET